MICEGGGELGALMRAHNWSTSPIGSPDTWPQSLRTAVSIMLSSKYPMFVAWGLELAFLYNDAYRPVLGSKHPSALGRPFRDVWSEIWDEIKPLVQTALRGDATWSENLPLILERNGYPEDSWFTCSYSPLRDDSGKIAGLFCVAQETTTHVQKEKALILALDTTRNEFFALYEKAPGFIATSQGEEHRFTFANASYLRFVGRDQLVGRTVAEAMPEIVDQGFIDLLDKVYQTGEPFVGESMKIEIADPETGAVKQRYSDFIYQPVRDAKGVITGLFCEGYDVTEQRHTADSLSALQSELIHVSRINAMGTMATTLAHELNQPLSAIANYTAGMRLLVKSQREDDGQLSQALHGIDEAAHRAAEIIRSLREQTRRSEPARNAFNLKVAIDDSLRLVRATADPSVLLADDIADDLMMFADRIQIQQVVINLLRNACDATLASDQRQVTIAAKQVGEDVIVSVVDTGVGVPLTAAECIFERAASPKEDGMGLGLSISRTIIDAHHGRIWLEKSGPEGSEFRFSVPLA